VHEHIPQRIVATRFEYQDPISRVGRQPIGDRAPRRSAADDYEVVPPWVFIGHHCFLLRIEKGYRCEA
jgi:hypothetical protein